MVKFRLALLLIIIFGLGISLTVSGVSNLIKMNGTVKDFNFDSMQDIKAGDFVQGYVLNIDGCYAYTTTTRTKYGVELDSHISEEYFLMPLVNDTDLEDEMYITIIASDKKDRDLLYDICDATWEYYEGNDAVVFPDMGIVAKVNKLDSEYEGYLVETMLDAEYFGSASEVRSHIVPYALTIFNPTSAYTSLGIGLVIVVLFIVVALVIYSKHKAANNPSFAPSAPADDFTIQRKPSESGFDETHTAPQPVPIPDIPQPVQPDDFFARTPKAAAPAVEEPVKEEPAAPAASAPAENSWASGNMDELDTSGIFDDADYADDFDTPDDEFDNDSDYSE